MSNYITYKPYITSTKKGGVSAVFLSKKPQNFHISNTSQTAVKEYVYHGLGLSCSPLLHYHYVSTSLTVQIPNGNAIAKPLALLHTGKERDSETGFSYFGARYYDSDLMTGWLSVDPMADKYPGLSPYAYCGWNPVRLVDPNGEEIDISALYDKNGKCKYEFIETALKAFAKTNLGYKELSKYAKGGQEILGVKFDKDGEYHSKGMDLSFGGETFQHYYSGDTRRKIFNDRLKITINLSNINEIKSIFETICHETFIHARQAANDYDDNGKLDHSYLAPYLGKYVNEQGKTNDAYINAEHCQFAWYDKNSRDDFIKTMCTQYPKSSNDEI